MAWQDLLISIRTQQQTGNAGSPRVKHAVENINGSRKAKGCSTLIQVRRPGLVIKQVISNCPRVALLDDLYTKHVCRARMTQQGMN